MAQLEGADDATLVATLRNDNLFWRLHAAGLLTGDVARPILGRDAKVEVLTRLSPDTLQAIAIGDGANDLGMIERAGMGVAVHAKKIVAEAAPYAINHGDLTACLFLQGYSVADFA